MDNNKFDFYVPRLTDTLTNNFLQAVANLPGFKDAEGIDTSPLLNMTLGVYLGSLVSILDKIKETTVGEPKLLTNIQLAQDAFVKVIEDLPFMRKKIKWVTIKEKS